MDTDKEFCDGGGHYHILEMIHTLPDEYVECNHCKLCQK